MKIQRYDGYVMALEKALRKGDRPIYEDIRHLEQPLLFYSSSFNNMSYPHLLGLLLILVSPIIILYTIMFKMDLKGV